MQGVFVIHKKFTWWNYARIEFINQMVWNVTIELHEKLSLTGAEISLSTGDWLKIAPAAKRQFFAFDISGITYICIQVKENPIKQYNTK